MSASSLQNHIYIAHVILFPQVKGVEVGGGGLEVYKVSYPRVLKLVECPVEGFPTKAKTSGRLR